MIGDARRPVQRPKAPNRDALDSAIPLNRAQNRRIVIELEKID